METSRPTTEEICATCAHWKGRVKSDSFCQNVQFDDNESADCAKKVLPVYGHAGSCYDYCSRWGRRKLV